MEGRKMPTWIQSASSFAFLDGLSLATWDVSGLPRGPSRWLLRNSIYPKITEIGLFFYSSQVRAKPYAWTHDPEPRIADELANPRRVRAPAARVRGPVGPVF